MSENTLDRPGRFRADSVVVGLLPGKGDSQSVAAVFDFTILEMWDETENTWQVWAQYRQTTRGYQYIIKANGDVNTPGVEALMKAMGWSGNVEELVEGTGWKPKPCQITVESETYNGKTSLRVNWINDWNSVGGSGLKTADVNSVKALALKYGAKLRAIAGNLARNTPKAPTAKAPPPQPTYIPPEHVFDPADPALQDFP